MAVIILAAFKDVPKKHWAYSVVEQAYNEGITKGVTEKLFEPDRHISRQEVALMLYRVHSKCSEAEDISSYPENYAEDLTAAGIASWAAPELAYGFENGYWFVDDFAGDGAGLASRELIARWACSIDTQVFRDYGLRILPYKDVADIDPAYYGYADTLRVNGVMKGTDTGMFNAKKSISRAEVAAVTVRTLNVIRKESKELENNPFKYELGVLGNIDEQTRSFLVGELFVNIQSDAKILIDGHASSFADIKLLEGKKISVSQYMLGDNINTVWIQSGPAAFSGIVEKTYSAATPDGKCSYEVVSLNIDGVSTDFILNSNTEVIRTITPGNEVQFISDGIYLQEIK